MRKLLLGKSGKLLGEGVARWLRGGGPKAKLYKFAVLMAVLGIVLYLAGYLLVAYVVLRVVLWVARRVFVKGEGRPILADAEPFVRPATLRRAGARAVDFAVLLPLVAVVDAVAANLTTLAFVVLSVGYFGTTSYVAGSTLGKSALGFEVVPTNGSRLTPAQSVVRETVATLSLFVLPVAGYVVMKNEGGEQMGDVLADTKVIAARQSGVAGVRSFVDRLTAAGGNRTAGGPGGSPSGGATRAQTKMQGQGRGGTTNSGQGGAAARTKAQTRRQSRTGSGSGSTAGTAPQSASGRGSETGPTASGTGGSAPRNGGSSTGDGDTDVYTPSGGDGSGDTSVFDPSGTGDACPDCGAALPETSNFCPECGSKV